MYKSVLLALAMSVLSAKAQQAVVDAAQISQNATNEVVNFLKWAQTQTSNAATELHTLGSYQNSITGLTRMGNAAAITNIPGVSQIVGIANNVGQIAMDAARVKALIDPKAYQNNLSSVLSSYGQPQWNGYTSGMGVNFSPNQANFGTNTAQWQASQQIQNLISQAAALHNSLASQRDALVQAMQSAPDQATVQKDHAAIDAMNGSLAQLEAYQAQLSQQAQLLISQMQAGQQVMTAVQSQQNAANYQAGLEANMLPGTGIPTSNAGSTNAMVTSYGYVGDLTPDTNSSNGIGAFSFDSAKGSLIPLQSAALTPSEAQTLGVQPGQYFTLPAANGQTYTLQYADVTPQTYNGVNLGNRVDIYDPNGVLGGNSFSSKTVSTGSG